MDSHELKVNTSVALAKSKGFVSPHILLVVLYCHPRNYLVVGGDKHRLPWKEKVGTVFLSSPSAKQSRQGPRRARQCGSQRSEVRKYGSISYWR